MTKHEFETFLEAKTSEAKTTQEIDWKARKKDWLKSLSEFFKEVERWLTDYVATGKIGVKPSEVTIEEDYIGSYRAESRVLTIGTDRVVLRPIGTLLIGARGRVDMEGSKGTVKFVLTGRNSNGIRVSITVGPTKGSAKAQKREPEAKAAEEYVWKIATPPPKVQFIELKPESFFDALMEVVNG